MDLPLIGSFQWLRSNTKFLTTVSRSEFALSFHTCIEATNVFSHLDSIVKGEHDSDMPMVVLGSYRPNIASLPQLHSDDQHTP